jgi:hypothetical protein
VWLVYGLGLVGGTVLLFSALFTAAARAVDAEHDTSLLPLLPWGALVVVAVAVWISRRRRR